MIFNNKIKENSNFSTIAELRLLRDLLVFKQTPLSTNKFLIQVSNIIKDEEQSQLSMLIKFQVKSKFIQNKYIKVKKLNKLINIIFIYIYSI
jgi:hypothetical protein